MKRIFLECKLSGQGTIYNLTPKTWEKTGQTMPELSTGIILGCGLAEFKTSKGKPDTAAMHLFQILIAELAHLIWKIQCKWKIGKES